MTAFYTQAEAEARAAELGPEYLAYYSPTHVVPWRVARLPQVGDAVSYAFNGDSYPCGYITKIWKNHSRIITSEGREFARVSPMAWKQGGKRGTWSLTQGHVEKRNPHF